MKTPPFAGYLALMVSLSIDGVFHIHHVTKGRYKENSQLSKVRSNIRLSQK